jgi:hypothetical protein
VAKLTRAQRKELLDTLYHLERAQRFLAEKQTRIQREYGGEWLTINKEMGSDLQGLEFAHDGLRRLVATT